MFGTFSHFPSLYPAAPSLSPKHTIDAFSIYIVPIVYLSFELECENNENKQKEAGICQFLNKCSEGKTSHLIKRHHCFFLSLSL